VAIDIFARDDVTHTAGRVFHMTLPARDQIHVAVKNGLSCDFAVVCADVEPFDASIRSLYRSFLLLQETVAGVELRASELEEPCTCRFGITNVCSGATGKTSWTA
jgi:hypothetical protein